MISFKDITLADKDTITSFTMKSDRRNCDLSFSNLCSWRFLYDTKFAVVDNFLVFKFWAGEQLAYMMPIGTGDLKAILRKLIEDADKEKQSFCMLGVCSNMRVDLETTLPSQFVFTEDRDYADYIYLKSDLSTLKGKKFQSKRNHINRFRNTYPDYEYTPITPDRIQECLDLEAEWCKVNNCDQQEGTGNERRALIYALHNFEALGLTGGILHVNSKIVAFTFGMPINHETFGVHVEKADTNIEGAYAMINYEFANRFRNTYPDYEYTPITPDRIQECLDLEAEWCKVNNCDQQEGTGNERRALIYALHNFEALGLTGGILHVNSKIVAFTFGMPINHETFGVHVEKADTNIEGAYAMINYEFANRIPEQYIYINREEDLGIEGLRKAKLSYQPVTILEKYMACLQDHPMNMVKW